MTPGIGDESLTGVSGLNPQGDRDQAVRAAHAAMDVQTMSFAARTGLRCPDGCGKCCNSPDVEASVIDVTPLASELVARGGAERVLERIDERSGDRRCVLYEADPMDSARGRCSMYEFRPSICRLFGFAGRRDADGAPQFTPCRVHVETLPEIAMAMVAAIRTREIPLPVFADLAAPIAAIDPGPRGQLRPINDALREAIHAVALASRLADDRRMNDDDDQSRPRPRTPSAPRRARRKAA